MQIIKDILSFYKFKKNEHKFKIGFFCESSFIFEYLEPYILKKQKKNKVLIISFEEIDNKSLDKSSVFVFYTKIFRELVFLTLRLKILYSSTPNLNQTIFQKTKTSKCKYIYLQHTPVSMTMIYTEDAFDHFDAIQVISKYQYDEMIEIKLRNNLKIKVFKSKYQFIKKQIDSNQNIKADTDLLIAPSWNSGFYKLNCHIILKDLLDKNNISYKFRPHPMSFKKKEITKKELIDLKIPLDLSNFFNPYKYNFFLSDWSGIFIEYALIIKRKAFLINTPKKMVNEKYLKFKNQPAEITLRNKIGKTFDIDKIENIINDILDIKNNNNNLILTEDISVKKMIYDNFY